MYRFEEIISMIDHSLSTRRRRHIAGGILMSISFLFGGLAMTIITMKSEDDNSEKYLE
jgi:hypothetical protein